MDSAEHLTLHAAPHPHPQVRRAGFPIDHPYVEHCWAPILGPSSVLLLRRVSQLWHETVPAQVPTAELSRQLGLGGGTGRHSQLLRTAERLANFGFLVPRVAGELEVYTEAPPVSPRQLERLPTWSRSQHDHLLSRHIDQLAGADLSAPGPGATTPAARLVARIDRLAAAQRPAGHDLAR